MAPADGEARRQWLRGLLLDLLRAACLPAWPGGDALTADEVLLTYPEAASAGRVPDLERLLCEHPQLAGELRTLFATGPPRPEPRP